MSKKLLLGNFALLAMILFVSMSAMAQGTTSRITGTVVDRSGAPVTGAMVTIKRSGAGITFTGQTGDSGTFLFDLIQAGTYEIVVEKAGFKKFVSTGNVALINQPATVNVSLDVGDVSAVVTVEGSSELVQTSSSGNFGGTIEQRTLEALPIVGTRGRNPLDILNFQPGVVTGANTGGGVHVNGSRDRAFNFTLDGIDINESTAGGSNFTPLRPNPDSIQEFQIVTSGFTAELGRSSGAQVTFVTRSGTNQFRGSIFDYYQTPRFLARSYAANVNRTGKEQFVAHIFGGSFSGPLFNPGLGEGKGFSLLRDKAFFFVNLQMLRAYDSLLSTRTVYTQSARQGIFRWVQGGVNGPGSVDAAGNPVNAPCSPSFPGVPAATPCVNSYNIATGTATSLDPVLMAYINRMPLPNSFSATGDGLNTAGFLFNAPQNERQYDFVTKFDFKINDANSVYVRYAQGQQNTFGDGVNGGRPRFPGAPNFVDTYRTPKNLAINWRWAPTSRFVNEFIFGRSQFGFKFLTPTPDPAYAFAFNLPTDIITNFSYNARSFRTWQIVDNMTFDFSPHVIKAGVNIRLGRSNDDRASVAGGGIELAYDFSRTVNNNFTFPTLLPTGTAINTADRTRMENMINDVLGRVGNIRQAFVNDPNNPSAFASPGTRWLFEANHPEFDFYVQDTWKMRPNFTVDIGARWEMRLSPTAAGSRPILVPDKPITLGSTPANNLRWVGGKLFKNEYGLILPSIGFAWDPFGTGKTSVRANYRMASDRFGTFLFSSAIFQSTPGNTALGSNTTFGASGGLLRNGLPSVVPTGTPASLGTPPAFSTNALNVMDPDLKFPRIHNWSLGFQREVFGGNVVEINYIGKKATNLFGSYNVNQVNLNGTLPGTGETFLQAFNSIRGNMAYVSPLINQLFTGSAANANGTARFRLLNATAITQGSAATLAFAASQKTCVTAEIALGLCTAAGQRVLDVWGFGSFFQPFSQYTGGLFVTDSNDFSFYNGLEFSFKRRMKKGLSFQLGYTWALSKDSRSFDPVFTTVATGTGQAAGNTPFDNSNRKANYAWSDFDRRHSLLGTYVYELPFGKGKPFGGDSPAVLNYIISGWQIAGTLRVTSGRPFTVFSGLNTLSQTAGSFANCSACPRNLGSLVQGDFDNPGSGLRNWFFDAAGRNLFRQPGPGESGNTGRNHFIGPRFTETDISVLRKFRFTERLAFDLRVDVRNLTNTPNFAAPSAVLPAGLAQSGNVFGTSIFGRINADTTNNNRRIQFSGKLSF